MPYSITRSTKILTLEIAPKYFYCPLMKRSCTRLPEETNVHIQQLIHQKELSLCLPLYYNAKVLVELGKTQARNLNVL